MIFYCHQTIKLNIYQEGDLVLVANATYAVDIVPSRSVNVIVKSFTLNILEFNQKLKFKL